MIWVVLGLIGIVFILYEIYDIECSIVITALISPLVVIGVSLVTLLIAGLFSAITSDYIDHEYELAETTEIYALKDNFGVSGTHYLYSTHIESDLYYLYVVDTEFGKTIEKVKADNVYIKYSNEHPRIETYSADFVNKIWYAIAAPVKTDRYIIYCPEDTITTEYNINLE